MVAVAGGGCSGHGRVTEVAAVMPRRVVVAVWHGGCSRGHMA
jgi:hypothetical protein